MSLCDKCYAPGQCCKSLHLAGKDGEAKTYWVDEGDAGIIEQLRAQGLPFVPLLELGRYVDAESGREYADLLFNCPMVTPSGRCSIYDDRPALCRNYEPLSDPLCVHFGGAEAGEGCV